MHFQWYPGHMTKAKRMMQENMKLVDLVIELVDARIPLSSRNPDIDELGKNKARLVLLKIERDRKRGILNRPVRAMVVGIPNVGKSTFINSLAGRACTKTGNKPGVTKGKQWIRLNKQVELLDTPGILWPKFEDQQVGLRMALIGSIKDEILNTEELAAELIRALDIHYPGILEEKYRIDADEAVNTDHMDRTGNISADGQASVDPYRMLAGIAESRHCLLRGNELDTDKAAALLLDDFRNGRIGRLTLEYP